MGERKKSRPEEAEIVLKTDGFSKYHDGRELFHVRWADVREVRAYKRDLLTTDLVCLGFRDTEDDKFWEVHEEMIGFDQFMKGMGGALSLDTDWYERVVQPAFAPSATVLFRRDDQGVA